MTNEKDDAAQAARVRTAANAIWLATFGAVLAIWGVVLTFRPDVSGAVGGSMIASGLICAAYFGYRARRNNPGVVPRSSGSESEAGARVDRR